MRYNSLACASVVTICSLCAVVTAWKPKITPEKEETIIQEGDELRLECRGEGELRFSKQLTMANGSEFNTFKNKSSNVYTLISSKTVRADTGWYACAENGTKIRNDEQTVDHESKDIAWIYVYVNSSEPFAIDTSHELLTVREWNRLVVPCRPTSPNVSVRLELDGGITELPENTTYDPKIGFIIHNVRQHQFGDGIECVVDGPQPARTSYVTHIAASATLEDPKINRDRIRHVVWGRDMTVECSITVPPHTMFEMSWKVPASVPKERWNYSPQPKPVSSESLGTTWKSELTVKNVEPSDGGEYTCVVEHLQMKHETTEVVRIWDPSYTYLNATVESLNNMISHEHENAFWKIAIDAYPENVTLAWYKPDESEIAINHLGTAKTRHSKYSHTNESLFHFFHVFKLNVEDNGNYTLELSNVARQINITLHLTVLAKPSVLLKEVQPFYSLGKLATFSCQTTGQPSPNITWIIKEYPDVSSKENFELKYPSNVTTKQGPKGPYQSVSTLQVIINQTGEVTCRSCNEINCARKTKSIIVSDIPEYFSIIAPSLQVSAGDNISVICKVSRHIYDDTVKWRFEDSTKQGSPSSRINYTQSGSNFSWQSTLQILNVTKSDAQTFVCEAITKQGLPEKKEYQLIVHDASAPRIQKTVTSNATVTIDLEKHPRKSLTLKCFVEGMPVPRITWYKDEKPISANNQFKFLNDNSTLEITHFISGDGGRYLCKAENRIGQTVSYTDIAIAGESQSNILWISVICVLVVILIVSVTYTSIKVSREKKLRMDLRDLGLAQFDNQAVDFPDLNYIERTEPNSYFMMNNGRPERTIETQLRDQVSISPRTQENHPLD